MDPEFQAILRGELSCDEDESSDSDDVFEIEKVKLKGVKIEEGQFGVDDEPPSTPKLDKSSVPCVGKKFLSLNEAEIFYRDYARNNGFEMRIRTRRRNRKTGEFTSCLFECKKAHKSQVEANYVDKSTKLGGKTVRRRDVMIGTGCRARMFVTKNRNHDDWLVSTFEALHNHDVVSPSKVNFMATYHNVSATARSSIDVYRKANVGASKIHHILATQAGGIDKLGFGVKDIENVIRDLRKGEGTLHDAQSAIDYMNRLKEDSGGSFFYRARCTDDNRVKTLVWVDGRSRAAYKCFGDVVTFDTTYRTNRYDMPFAPFTGVNHHYHSILFGFALLGDEKEETFDWVLSTWLEAMDGVAPQSIITDQCQQIGDAIRKIFPMTHHGLCTWHISNKYPDKLNQVYKHHPNFKADYDTCVIKSLTIFDFEQRWAAMMEKYELNGHDWLNDLYALREQWIPSYTKRFFAAGMTTTARSEGMNHFFDQYVSSCTSLKDFVQKSVEDALEKQLFRERKDDFDSKYYSRKLELHSALEKHASTTYTKAMFKRFQTELRKSMQFTLRKFNDGCVGSIRTYLCRNDCSKHYKDRRVFRVDVCNETSTMKCTCQMFEHMGILCRHLLKYLTIKCINAIPSQYIVRRWTIGANKVDGAPLQGSYCGPKFDLVGSQTARYNHLSQLFLGIALDASCSKAGYNYALSVVAREKDIIASFKPDCGESATFVESENTEVPTFGEDAKDGGDDASKDGADDEDDMFPSQVLDPEVAARKGRKREKRMKKPIEEQKKQKRLRLCAICKTYTDHDKRNHDKMVKRGAPTP